MRDKTVIGKRDQEDQPTYFEPRLKLLEEADILSPDQAHLAEERSEKMGSRQCVGCLKHLLANDFGRSLTPGSVSYAS